jgi:hypothetical protein
MCKFTVKIRRSCPRGDPLDPRKGWALRVCAKGGKSSRPPRTSLSGLPESAHDLRGSGTRSGDAPPLPIMQQAAEASNYLGVVPLHKRKRVTKPPHDLKKKSKPEAFKNKGFACFLLRRIVAQITIKINKVAKGTKETRRTKTTITLQKRVGDYNVSCTSQQFVGKNIRLGQG